MTVGSGATEPVAVKDGIGTRRLLVFKRASTGSIILRVFFVEMQVLMRERKMNVDVDVDEVVEERMMV